MTRLPYHVILHSAEDPALTRGGVRTFARILRSVFEQVTFMTPASRDLGLAERDRLPIVCDNQMVLDWPERLPAIGFQHGIAAVKFGATRALGHAREARREIVADFDAMRGQGCKERPCA